jgi:hypothetical protein
MDGCEKEEIVTYQETVFLSECALYLKWRRTNDVFHMQVYFSEAGIGAKLGCARQTVTSFSFFCSDLPNCCSV